MNYKMILEYDGTSYNGWQKQGNTERTIQDVYKRQIERCADATGGEPLVPAYSNIESIQADGNNVVITLKEPNTEFLAYMTTAIIPKDYDELDTQPMGTGPFRYVSRSPQENIVIEKFTDYWGEPAYLDKVEFKIVADADTIVMSLKGGSIDMYARLTSSQAAELKDDFNIEEGTMNLVQALYLNHAAAPFDNKLVRQAMCYAVNPQEVMMMIADGKGTEIEMCIRDRYDVCGHDQVRNVRVNFSLGAGLYCTLESDTRLTQELLDRVKARMQELVERKIPVMKRSVNTDDAIRLFGMHGMYDLSLIHILPRHI